MKKLHEMKRYLLGALAMLCVSIPLLVIAQTLEEKHPDLTFEGMRMEMKTDGSVQVFVDVSIQDVELSGALPAGARFRLNCNPEYMTPSNYKTNEKLNNGDNAFLAFQYSPDLYQVLRPNGNGKMELVPEDPFNRVLDGVTSNFGFNNQIEVTNTRTQINLNLVARTDTKAGSVGITWKQSSMGSDKIAVFNKTGKIILGTLSFRIEPENVNKLPEIKDNFGGISWDDDPEGENGKYLIWHEIPKTNSTTALDLCSWAIIVAHEPLRSNGQPSDRYSPGCFLENSLAALNNTSHLAYNPYAESHFAFNFPTLIISVEPVEPKLTVDAYQAYTTGHISDLDIVLQKYSPAVLVKYSDGTQENVIFPWGRTTDPWTASKVIRPWREGKVDWADTTGVITDADYDPTHGDYKIQKLYCYADPDDPTKMKTFPLPVSVHLTVTPITLVDVTATDLYRVYRLNDSLVSGAAAIRELSNLDLPNTARLITDVPAGGATLTMPIPGWSHTNVAGDETNDPVYWPFNDPINGIQIKDLWKDKATTGEYLHWPTESDATRWGQSEANGVALGENRAGDYTFVMAKGYGKEPVKGFQRDAIKAAYPWLTVPDCTKLPDDPESWPLENALRRIVWDGSENGKKLEDKNRYQVTYESTITDSTTYPERFLPTLTLQVKKTGSGGGFASLPETTLFRVKLPDGTLVGTNTVTADVNTGDWFDEKKGDSGRYTPNRISESVAGAEPYYVFDLDFNPGDTDVGEHDKPRELLLRYINLGGWFSVSINEDPNSYYWSDFIPVYVKPRDNIYLEDKVYNFVGENKALYHFVNVGEANPMIPTTVTFPAGSYETVSATGVPEYDDGDAQQLRHTERYGVKTLYNGVTGSQFGELNTFSIEDPPGWDKDTSETDADGNSITRYGANEFKHSDARYGAYNYVNNPGLELYQETGGMGSEPESKYRDRYYTATIRTQSDLLEPEKPSDPDEKKEKIKLVYEGPVGGVTPHDPTIPLADRPNVELVTFDTQVEGYTVRQEYTLTIVNVGDVDINGLSIDMLNDKLWDLDENGNRVPDYNYWEKGGNFTLLKPPASFLPAGEKTTFTLSYVYDLRARNGSEELEYLDKLFITSDKKHDVDAGAKAEKDYLLDFDARFVVSGSKIHHVWVEYNPTDGWMGTAQVIVGARDDGSGNTYMNINAGSNAATEGMKVYVMATPTDEYKVQDCKAVASNGSPVFPIPWTGKITLPDGTTVNVDEDSQIRIWYFDMLDYDVTVTVNFYEPISSKLRLSDLWAYAAPRSENLYDSVNNVPADNREENGFKYAVWQKSFTEEELDAAEKIHPDAEKEGAADPNRAPTEEEKDRYLMQYGTVTHKGYDEKVNQYLVVVPYDAERSQIEATLRQIQAPYLTDSNKNLPLGANDELVVEMTWFSETVGPKGTDGKTPFKYDSDDVTQIYLGHGDTSVPTVHTSEDFDSPSHGNSNYVRIWIHYSNAQTGEDVSRYYFVEIHRMPEYPEAELNYGNSPYGMIMNATNIVGEEAEENAKGAFVNNKYSFDGLSAEYVPLAAKEVETNTALENYFPAVNDFTFTKLHYWTEAWVAVNAQYEPESGRGVNIYKEEDNLDLSNTAFFAIIGEPFRDPGLMNVKDSTGRPGRIDDAVLSLEVYTLDDTPGLTQTERFALPANPNNSNLPEADKAALQGRTITLRRNTPAGSTISDWSSLVNTEGQYIRPGRYKLIYTLPDFDYDDYMATPEDKRDPKRDPTLKVERDFVVLAPVGDVNSNMPSGAANANSFVSNNEDHLLVKGRITQPLGYMANNYPDGAIFKFRTCDVNNDRNINNIDANTIRVGKSIRRYYLPIDYKR